MNSGLLQSHLTWEWMQILLFPTEDNYKTVAGVWGFLSSVKGELFKGAICKNCLLDEFILKTNRGLITRVRLAIAALS